MRKLLGVAALTVIVACASPLWAQDCTEDANVGPFLIEFNGVTYDGVNSTFDYCVTGVDNRHALSNWLLSLSTECIAAADLVSCGPAPCFYQVNDPHYGLTGIKFDDVEVNDGQTVCYSFTLGGNWTNLVGETTLGLKAATETWTGDVCGPTCESCSAKLAVKTREGGNPRYSLDLHHMRATTVTTLVTYQVLDASNKRVRSWTEGPITLVQGAQYTSTKAIPGDVLPAGHYTLRMQMAGMSGWVTRNTQFDVTAP